MGPKVYLVLLAVSIIGMVAAFIFFIITLASDKFYSDPSVSDILITIFMFVGLIMVFVILMVYSLIKYSSAGTHSARPDLTKQCISCGTTIGITELTCPRCFTLQPPGGSSPTFFRRKH